MRMRTLLSVVLLTAACHSAPPPSTPTVVSVSTTTQPSPAQDAPVQTPLRESIHEATLAPAMPPAPTESYSQLDLGEGRSVDPIIPSWAPLACYQYFRNVVDALACPEIPHAARELIQRTYQASSASWQTTHDVSADALTAIGKSCADSAALVAVEKRGKCKG